jgi:transposase
MILNPSGARVWLAAGHTDMRKGFDGLALLVQETLKRDPRSGHLFVFRGRRDGLIKVLWLLFDRIGGGGAGGRGLERGQDRRQASQTRLAIAPTPFREGRRRQQPATKL